MSFLINLIKKSAEFNNVSENVYFSPVGLFLIRKVKMVVLGKPLLSYFLQLTLIIKLLNSFLNLLTYSLLTLFSTGNLPLTEVKP